MDLKILRVPNSIHTHGFFGGDSSQKMNALKLRERIRHRVMNESTSLNVIYDEEVARLLIILYVDGSRLDESNCMYLYLTFGILPGFLMNTQ